jgi:hypothetical protein
VELRFEVGTTERHEVAYAWDQMWGRESLAVDGVDVLKSVQLMSFSLVRVREATVGEVERHRVRVEKRRELILAGFRPQVITAYVDDEKVAEGISTISSRQIRSLIVFGIVLAVVVVTLLSVGVIAVISLLLNQG